MDVTLIECFFVVKIGKEKNSWNWTGKLLLKFVRKILLSLAGKTFLKLAGKTWLKLAGKTLLKLDGKTLEKLAGTTSLSVQENLLEFGLENLVEIVR